MPLNVSERQRSTCFEQESPEESQSIKNSTSSTSAFHHSDRFESICDAVDVLGIELRYVNRVFVESFTIFAVLRRKRRAIQAQSAVSPTSKAAPMAKGATSTVTAEQGRHR